MKTWTKVIGTGLTAALLLTGCTVGGYTSRGALYGAGAGALIGGLAGGSGSDALTGAALGALGGAIIGSLVEEAEYDSYGHRRRYPYARRTSYPGLVVSPYPPYNRIDIRGFPRGAYVRDPSTGGIFRVP